MCTEDKDIVLGCSANQNQHKSQNKERAQIGQRDRYAKGSESQTNLSRCTPNRGIASEGSTGKGGGHGSEELKTHPRTLELWITKQKASTSCC